MIPLARQLKSQERREIVAIRFMRRDPDHHRVGRFSGQVFCFNPGSLKEDQCGLNAGPLIAVKPGLTLNQVERIGGSNIVKITVAE